MRWLLALVLLVAGAGDLAAQSKGKGIRLWNLTTETISASCRRPARTFGDRTRRLNDKDKEVDHDERLRIMGVEPAVRRQGQLSRRGNASSAISRSRRMRCSRSRTRT